MIGSAEQGCRLIAARQQRDGTPIANRLVEAKNAVPFRSRGRDLHVDQSRLAIEQPAHADFAVDVDARGQAVAARRPYSSVTA